MKYTELHRLIERNGWIPAAMLSTGKETGPTPSLFIKGERWDQDWKERSERRWVLVNIEDYDYD